MTLETNIEPRAMAHSGLHDKLLESILKCAVPDKNISVLDVGAGQGALSKLMDDAGYNVKACDFNKENFVYNKIEFKETDVTKQLPYEDDTFDIVVAAELVEHILDQTQFFKECIRVLKQGGNLVISTPNILSLKSRLQFFASGYYWSFQTLDIENRDGLQHITGRTVEEYQYITHPLGLNLIKTNNDKFQGSSKWLLIFYPIMFLIAKGMKKDFHTNNTLRLMLSRTVFMVFKKN